MWHKDLMYRQIWPQEKFMAAHAAALALSQEPRRMPPTGIARISSGGWCVYT
jgi:hypothetical protein